MNIPSDIELEACVLSSCLNDPFDGQICSNELDAEDFSSKKFRFVFSGICAAIGKKIPSTDIVSLAGTLNGLNGATIQISELMKIRDDAPICVDMDAGIFRLRDLTRQRRIQLFLHESEKKIQAGINSDDLMSSLSNWLSDMQTASKRNKHFDNPVDVLKCLAEKPAPVQFLIKDRIPIGRGILITGVGGSSKTRLLYHLAIGARTGSLPWDWEVSKTGKSVLILTEDTMEDVHRTIFYMVRDLGLSHDEIKNDLVIFPMAGKQFKLMVKTATGTVERSRAYNDLIDKIKTIGDVVFIGIDPALSISEGDELDQYHQRELGKMADDLAISTGATCALVSHASKASLNTAELNSHNSRGGGAITDAVRAEYTLRNMTQAEAAKARIDDPEEKKRIVQLVCTKANSLPPSAFVPVWLRRNDNGCLLETEISLSEIALTENDKKILEVLIQMSRLSTPTLSEWKSESINKGLLSEIGANKAIERVRKKLQSAGLIEKGIGKGVWKPLTQ